jgi:hypothetical protein
MDGIFKEKLLSLRRPPAPTSFAEALLGDTSWLKVSAPSPSAPNLSKESYSEKVQVIESLERFAQEKILEQKSPVLQVPGGEVVLKSLPGWEEIRTFEETDDLFQALTLDKRFLEIVLGQKRKGEIKAIFISEKFRPWSEVETEFKAGFLNELIVGFPLKTAELFEKMIAAMKLIPSEVIILPVEGQDESDYSREVMEVAAHFSPEILITLGATATARILKSNDRLSMIHGQFFSRRVGSQKSFQIVPLFHPSIIETNQNMKKTAWADMQKIMRYLKKLP